MKRIIHISDLHFGTEHPSLVPHLVTDINQHAPDLIVISGDLTQRATMLQYQSAKAFLQSLQAKILCVPGNHDIPLYHILERLTMPFRRYRQWICESLSTTIVDDSFAVLGINSATPWKPMGGFVTRKQRQLMTDFFQKQDRKKIKIMVMHHNLIRSERHKIINSAEQIISLLATSNVNLVLCGHIHSPHIELLKRNYLQHLMYVITAGTPISTRTVAANSYNILDFSEDSFTMIVRTWDTDRFINNDFGTYSW